MFDRNHTLAFAIGLFLAAAPAAAGQLLTGSLWFYGSSAAGVPRRVLDDGNASSWLGCGVGDYGTSGRWGSCYALRDGYEVMCFTDDPGMLATIEALQPDSYLVFTTDGADQCTSVAVGVASGYL